MINIPMTVSAAGEPTEVLVSSAGEPTEVFVSITGGPARRNDEKAPIIIDTVSGEIASVSDGAGGMDARSLVVNIEPIQTGSGDPSPSNIRPISGRTGANVYQAGVNLINPNAFEDNYVYNKAGTKIASASPARSNIIIKVAPSTKYYLVSARYTNVYNVVYFGIDGAGLNKAVQVPTGWTGVEFTTPSNCYYVAVNVPTEDKSIISLNYPSTVTTYTPFSGSTIHVSWNAVAGTVYGGTLDVLTGKLTVTHGYVDLGTLSYSQGFSGFYTLGLKDVVEIPDSVTSSGLLSSHYVVGNTANADQMYIQRAASYLGWIVFLPSTSYANASAFKTAMDGVQLVYALATPQTYQLTPTEVALLAGVNNIFSDGGSITLEYPCDTKLYIQKLTQPSEDDMIANANIPNDTYFMVGNNLYLSTAAIATGGTIQVGTNCVSVSLPDALNALKP